MNVVYIIVGMVVLFIGLGISLFPKEILITLIAILGAFGFIGLSWPTGWVICRTFSALLSIRNKLACWILANRGKRG